MPYAPATPHETWEPIEISLVAERRFENPYADVTVRTQLEHESGSSYDALGFWDGDRNWTVRFAPPEPGIWTWVTDSDPLDDGLSRAGSFEVGAYEGENGLQRHGHLAVSERDPTLTHADGTPFFWLGDTVWSAPAKATTNEWRTYLKKRAQQGYSVVQLNALPQHDAPKPQRRSPFGEEWDLDAPRPQYFRTLDGLVQRAHDCGIVPALVALWFDYVPGANPDRNIDHTPFDEAQAARWGRYLGARYGAYGTVWLVSGDSEFPECALDIYDAVAEGIKEAAVEPLCTVHRPRGEVTPESINERDWFDFHAYQSGHARGVDRGNPFRLAETHRRMTPKRPVVNVEPCYENMGSVREGERFTRAEVRRAAWQSVLAGANAGVTYGGNGLWQWYREGESFDDDDWIAWMRQPVTWREGLKYPGAEDYARLKHFLTDFSFESLRPRQDLVAAEDDEIRAAVLPDDGVLLVYTPEAQAVTVELSSLDGEPVRTWWFHPGTGQRAYVPADEPTSRWTIEAPPWQSDSVVVCRYH